jgi:hypothetical protein
MENSKTQQAPERKKLDERLSGYTLQGIHPGKIHFRGQDYDFTDMDAATADKIIAAGCTRIKKNIDLPETGSAKPEGGTPQGRNTSRQGNNRR